jgi:hypothetical protein
MTDAHSDAKEQNYRRGGEAANLLRRLHAYEKESLSGLLDKVAQELEVSADTVSNYATGQRPIPNRYKPKIIEALRSFRWKVDDKWKLSTALSESLGINSRHFINVDEFIIDAKPTHYKLVRLNRWGELTTGDVTISPDGDAPRWWTYTYDTKNDITNETSTKEYSGPILAVDRIICIICSGRGVPGVGRYMRIEYIWPSSTPTYHESVGISLSTFSREGHPLAAPFVLVPMSRWKESISKAGELAAISERLRQMTQDGMIHLFPSPT